jgi:hypothetical protein
MALSAIFYGGIMMAQEWKQVQADPALPVKPGFDTNRAIFWAQPNFTPLRDPEWIPLRDALQSGQLEEDVPVLTIRVAGKILTFVTSQMSYHHVAQGDINGEPWMVTF